MKQCRDCGTLSTDLKNVELEKTCGILYDH